MIMTTRECPLLSLSFLGVLIFDRSQEGLNRGVALTVDG